MLSLLPPAGGRVVGSKGIDEALLEGDFKRVNEVM